MDAEARSSEHETPHTGLTWLDLARHVAAMTPEQKRRPVYFCDEGGGRIYTPGPVVAECDRGDESDQLLHEDASVISAGSFYLVPLAPTPVAPAHTADGLVLVALDLDDGEEPPADFETATGIYYTLSEVEDVGQGRHMAWYFQQGPPAPDLIEGMVPGAEPGLDARRHRREGHGGPTMPIYLTGYIDDHTDRWKHYHDDFLPLGMIVQPKTHREGYLGRAGLYKWVAIDNGRFTEAGRRLFRPDEYDRLIRDGLERAGDHLLFATAPDEPFDWAETLRLSRPWLRRIRRMGCPAALCAQEGMTVGSIPWDEFDCLFIGGRDAFKEGPLVRDACREARRRGKWVHMGRVNSLRRLMIALDFGVDSVDGTYLLHEAGKGRAKDAPHDVVGWLRWIHAERRRRVRRGLGRLGVEDERIDAFLGYHY